jgi:hypothetical protein
MPPAIDFTRIRGDLPEGQRGAFEELVCQLARRQAYDQSFRRIEGSGGDGGVECVHSGPAGGRVGYQAKYYCKPGDIDWQAIDRSLDTALATYPDLSAYVVAIPCDFTGRRRVRGGATSDGTWGEWDRRVEKWQAQITSQGRSVIFILWTATELASFLTPTEAGGLRTYWFNQTEFSKNWFANRLNIALAGLDERYSRDDHVDLKIQELFDFIIRHPRARKMLFDELESIKSRPLPENQLQIKLKAPASALKAARDAIKNVIDIEPEFAALPQQPWRVENWVQLASHAATKTKDLGDSLRKAYYDLRGVEGEAARRELQSLDYDLNDLYNQFYTLEELLRGRFLRAEKKRVALITGRAGTGKSHLLARIAEIAVSENRPVVFILGQQLRDGSLWPQILDRLGLQNQTVEDFLGALDAASERTGARGLILVDAINEGAGMRLWRSEIGSFLGQIERYANLACVFSCRSEYVDYLVPKARLKSIPRFEIRGFETPEEQAKAARVYLDRRGISRPATPWLAPEFVNPLFLRSCCNALQREGKTEFPRGLTGTKEIFAFFLTSVAQHLGTDRDGTTDLVAPTKATLLELASQMARDRKDHLYRDHVEEIARAKFKLFNAPPFTTWLEVLQRNGLLRVDPDPSIKSADPLLEAAEVVRFSFQRFQDHLMAEAVIVELTDIKEALDANGLLSFVHNGKRIHAEWRGLVEALSIQLPERFQVEFVDALPGSYNVWWHSWEIQDAFVQSIRWRTTSAFTQRALDLFNCLDSERERISLLIELAASTGHPWNAELIHRNLIRIKMVDRDVFWSLEVNKATEDSHPLYVLIDWSLGLDRADISRQTYWLCALVLTWSFSSSNRRIRDLATKALTTVLLKQPDIFPQLSDAFREVDDGYILERLYAAAYGACCIDPSSSRTAEYVNKTITNVFGQKLFLPNLLLRDYARGIVELANHLGIWQNGVAIGRYRPPYKSKLPIFRLTDGSLNRLADKAGDKSIWHSCDQYGDFGRYEIDPAIGKFVAVRLASPVPYSSKEKFDRFEKDIVRNQSDRVAALERLRNSIWSDFRVVFRLTGQRKPRRPTKTAVKKHKREIYTAEREFTGLLSQKERKRYCVEAKPWLMNQKTKQPKQINLAGARRWVAKRAYDFGWRKELFEHDSGTRFEYKTDRALVERIGKKYQWLALSELLCRLSDNYWIGGTSGDGTRKYDNPTDIGFSRDIDPTVLPKNVEAGQESRIHELQINGPVITISQTPEEELTKWPFAADLARNFERLVSRVDSNSGKWIVLYDHKSATDRYNPRIGQHGFAATGISFRVQLCCRSR